MGEPSNKVVLIGVLVVVAVSAGVGAGLMTRQPQSTPAAASDPIVAPPTRIEVHVAGWVEAPGVISLPQGAIVADAIAAAGGLKPGAAVDAINLASSLSSGEQVTVPGPGTTGSATDGHAAGPLSLNRATAVELQSLPGVGPVLADRIVAHRDTSGPFGAVEDLLDVPGIGEAKLASIRDLVRP